MRKLWTRLLPALFVFCMIAGVLRPSYALEHTPVRTVRVGYILSAGYQEGGEGEYKTGFGYEYYQKISYYTGWKYEYVYGGFSELLEKLKTGEIDIMGNLSYTEERAESIDFSSLAQGYESYYLLTLSDNREINEDNKQALNGKRVGISKGSLQYGLFLDWCKQYNVQCEVLEYGDKAEREADLNSGVIDATVTTRVRANDPNYKDWRSALKIGDSSYYFGISKKSDPAVLQELNAAMQQIWSANPHYFEDVHGKYFAGKLLTSDLWSTQEEAWLEAHQNSVTVGYLDNYLPFCDQDENGNVSGLLSDISDYVWETYQTRLNCVAFSRYDDMLEASRNDELNLIFPVHGDYWAAEQQGLFLSGSVASASNTLLYNGEYSDEKTNRISVTDMSPFQRYSTIIHYPGAEIVEYETPAACIRAIIDGDVGSTIFMSRYALLNNPKLESINQLGEVLLAEAMPVCFGISDGDHPVLSICDKWLSSIGHDALSQSIVAYSHINRAYKLTDFISDHPIGFLVMAVGIVVLIAFGAWRYVRFVKERSREQLAMMEFTNAAKQRAAEQKALADENQRQLENARMRIAMTQMQPHFLYNALSAIRTIVKRNPDYAYDLLYDFSRHLRATIKAMDSDTLISFSEEIENVEAYLNIERARFEGIQVVYDLQCEDFDVIPLSIQPLAENAARHGIRAKGAEGGTITVRSRETVEAYIIEVSDDGVGFDVAQALGSDSNSIGLKNLILRMKSLMNADVSIESEINKGTCVTIVIPKKESMDDSVSSS